MININNSNVKVTKIKEISEKLIVATAYTTHKVGEEFIKTFVDIKFVGTAVEQFKELGLTDKGKLCIIEGVLRNEPFKGAGYDKALNKLVITAFQVSAPVQFK